ncbi:MAG TPA: carboxypeptidase regulatory-like domain-containing protein, partial [Longimicrobiaceae bacterium]|nr:carboxypeptidase regulatory-like domain-containing protein [Longimicrobiaceae bacterium]
LHRVTPEDWPTYMGGIHRPDRRPAVLPGTEVQSRVLTFRAPPGEVTETFIDLSPALQEGVGQVLLAVEAMGGPEGAREQGAYVWVQVTRIGLSAFSDQADLVGWATSLADGRPLPGVELRLAPHAGAAATTDGDGLATLPLPGSGADARQAWLVARLGADVAILPNQGGPTGWATWVRRAEPDVLAWYAFTDRHLYRPGEEMRFKGWVRQLARGKSGGVRLVPGIPDSVRYVVVDPRGNELARGSARLTALGGFDATVKLPEGVTLGYAHVRLTLPGITGGDGQVGFRVDEFRRPEYQVAASAEPGPHLVGGSAEVTAQASYFSGGGLPGAPVRWSVSASPGYFTPPGWDRWSFGGEVVQPRGRQVITTTEASFASATDATGAHRLRIDFLDARPARTYGVSATALVEDVNRQTWVASAYLLVHSAAVFVGLRTERGWVEAGQPLLVDVVAVDVSGRLVPGRRVELVAERLEWRRGEGGWEEVPVEEAQRCALTSGDQPGQCTFATAQGGRYRVTASTTDAEGRPARSVLGVWVSGAAPRRPEQNEQATVEIVRDQETYQPGDTASLLLRLPFFPVRGVLTVRRGGLVRSEPIRSDGPTLSVRVPIGEDDIPSVSVGVDVVGSADAAGVLHRSARGTDFASGGAELSVPPLARKLAVEAVPADSALEPGAAAEVALVVRDAAGRPVEGAEVALVVVDEAVLALTGYVLPDPLAIFYPPRSAQIGEVHLRPAVLLVEEGRDAGPGRIVGRVFDTGGQPVGGATVAVSGTELRTVTDAAGRFEFSGLAEGSYTLVFSRLGLGAVSRPVTVGPEGAPVLRVVMISEALQLQ